MSIKKGKSVNRRMADKNKFAVEMINITKKFPPSLVIANDEITLRIKKGTIHGLVGENGSGKSTLASILSGFCLRDSGRILIEGKEVNIKNTRDAIKLGIGIVKQHARFVPRFTLFENICLGFEERKFCFFFDREKSRKKVENLMKKYNLQLNIHVRAADADVFSLQKAEVLKSLYQNAKIIIFDEPTAILPPPQSQAFMGFILALKREGRTVIFISHKLEEIVGVSQYLTVLRNGKVVMDTFLDSSMDPESISLAMFGEKIIKKVNNHR